MTNGYKMAVDVARNGETAVVGPFSSKYGTPSMRAYFYDADTGEELYGAIYLGNFEAGIFKGARYMNTRLAIEVIDLNTRLQGFVCADAFPGRRVIVKMWIPEGKGTEWVALVDRAKGWAGNETDCVGVGRAQLPGLAAMVSRCR